MRTCAITTYALNWRVRRMWPGLENQEILKLRGTYQHSSRGGCITSKRHLTKRQRGLGKLLFECRPPRRAHCVSFEILGDVAHIFSGIPSGGGRYGDRRWSRSRNTDTDVSRLNIKESSASEGPLKSSWDRTSSRSRCNTGGAWFSM